MVSSCTTVMYPEKESDMSFSSEVKEELAKHHEIRNACPEGCNHAESRSNKRKSSVQLLPVS